MPVAAREVDGHERAHELALGVPHESAAAQLWFSKATPVDAGAQDVLLRARSAESAATT